jgi:hypothetical protein
VVSSVSAPVTSAKLRLYVLDADPTFKRDERYLACVQAGNNQGDCATQVDPGYR